MAGARSHAGGRSSVAVTRAADAAELLRLLTAEVDAGRLGAESSSAKRLRSRIEGGAAALDAATGHSVQARAECVALIGGVLEMVARGEIDAHDPRGKRLLRYLEGAALALAAVDSTSE